jgi:dCTP deaminase
MALSKKDILKALGRKKDLVIRPFSEEQLNPNSYDVRLGNWFALLDHEGLQPFYWLMYVKDDLPVCIPSGETVLAHTAEFVGTKGKLFGQIHAKSSTRRKGTSICDCAGYGDVGYFNFWTLELTANTSHYTVVYTGQRIAQMSFTSVVTAPDPYEGQYTTVEWPAAMLPKDCRRNFKSVQYAGPYTLLDLVEERRGKQRGG